MSMSLSSAARDRRNRRIAAFQHRGRMFQHGRTSAGGGAPPPPPTPLLASASRSPSSPTAASSSPSTPATPSCTIETSVFDAPTIPAMPSPPASPKPPQRARIHSSQCHGASTEGNLRSNSPTMTFSNSPRSPTSFALLSSTGDGHLSSSSKKNKDNNKKALPLSPQLPWVSPSRSTDEGDERPVPLPSPAPLQQPNLSPRFRFAAAAASASYQRDEKTQPRSSQQQHQQQHGGTFFPHDGPSSSSRTPLLAKTVDDDDDGDDGSGSLGAAVGGPGEFFEAPSRTRERVPTPELRPRPCSSRPEEDGDDDCYHHPPAEYVPSSLLGVRHRDGGASAEGDDTGAEALLGGQTHRPASAGGRLSLKKLARAIHQGATALPPDLSRDERGLWEAVLQVLAQQEEPPRPHRPTSSTPVAVLASSFEQPPQGRSLPSSTSPPRRRGIAGGDSSENLPNRRACEMQENLPGSPKKDIPSSPRVTESALEGASPPSTPPWAAMMTVSSADDGEVKGDSGGSERTIRALEAELTRRNCRIRELERELSQQTLLPLTPTKPSKSPSSSPRHGNDDNSPPSPERSPTAATSRSEDSRDGGSSLASSSEESADGLVAKLRGELEDKASALENAKMIIASLESASGSLAADMRARVKSKDDELAAIKVEMANKQHALDTLATQLRDLQRSQSVVRCNRSREEERSRRLGLSSRLEKNMADFRAALVVLESTTHDPVALELISHLMSDTVQAMKDGIDVLDENLHATDEFSASGCGGDARRLRKELEEKTRAVQRLEEALRGEREECAQLRSERDRSDGTRDAELEALRVEVRSLQEQCCTNMEVLAKKERELVVLRDSLKVDDGVGYISDDGSEASETDADETPVSPVPQRLRYGPSQAEALATLLAQSSSGMGNKSSLSSDAAHELQVLKQELQQAHTDLERYRKQLKTEKESLVNAKMIISSLEKANKSIMDDLRSRLQDSNTAITSLLEKSIENEKMNSKLRVEVETLKKEKEQYETEISTLRSTFLDCRQSSLHGLLAPLEEKKDDKPETID